jgi:hypothetical protein
MRKEVSGMRWKGFALIGMALVVSGCATVGSSSLQKQCSDTTVSAIDKFLAGVEEFNLGIIRSVIPDGISVFSIFGEGDASRGRKIVGEVVDHPEIHRGNEVDSTYHMSNIMDTPERSVKKVDVERHDNVTLMNGNRYSNNESTQTIEQHSRRAFAVAFDSERNCILTVKLIDPEWIKIP